MSTTLVLIRLALADNSRRAGDDNRLVFVRNEDGKWWCWFSTLPRLYLKKKVGTLCLILLIRQIG
jgi:hypothetical protein